MSLDRPVDALDALPVGVLVLDATGTIVRANAAAAVGPFAGGPLPGRNAFRDFPDFPPLAAARDAFLLGMASGAAILHVGDARLRVRIRSFGDGDRAGAVALIEPVADGEALRATASAHDDMLRTVSRCRHDLNNSLMGLIGVLELLQMQRELSDNLRRRADSAMEEALKLRDRVRLLDPIR